MKNVRKLTEGAMLLAAFTVLFLISMYLPFVGMVSSLFLAVPFILFAAKNEGKWTIVFVVASILLSIIVGSFLSLPLALSFGTTGAVMGYLIQKKKERMTIFIASSFVLLINIIGMYAVSIVFFNMDIINEMINTMKDSIKMSTDMLKNLGQEKQAENTVKQFTRGLEMVRTLIPTLFVLTSFILTLMIQLVSYPIVKRFGVEIKKWKPFKDLSLPRSLLWYLLITLFANMVLNPQEGTYLFAVLLNLTYVLQFLMIFQGYTFMFYYFDAKGISKSVAVILAVFSFIIPIFLYIIGILGIIDLGFDLRKKFKKES
ncbi:YybS family protein [Neobacillus sp. 114]|uniref:YybS family protein n=1 Tax=Neobacillus sp. 114 TaxID=3048535 RepID=UPI001C23B256|nr:YybS family protein [Neobacillus sp. 114]MBU8914844.1 YybS family protein [Bacillus sp. FJAT-29953]